MDYKEGDTEFGHAVQGIWLRSHASGRWRGGCDKGGLRRSVVAPLGYCFPTLRGPQRPLLPLPVHSGRGVWGLVASWSHTSFLAVWEQGCMRGGVLG